MNVIEVRRLVQEALESCGLGSPEPLWETLLVSEGRLRGYRFEFDTLRVFWFHSSRTLEFYDCDWQLLKLIELSPRQLANQAA
jgi:hypothetical protein